MSTSGTPVRSACLLFAGALALAIGGCGGSDPVESPIEPTPPTAVTETFSDTLNQNGGRTHAFVVSRPGTITAQITQLSPDGTAIVGLSLGTWNGAVCQIILANDSASLNVSVTGTAASNGAFCARVYDVGRLTGPVDYAISVNHF